MEYLFIVGIIVLIFFIIANFSSNKESEKNPTKLPQIEKITYEEIENLSFPKTSPINKAWSLSQGKIIYGQKTFYISTLRKVENSLPTKSTNGIIGIYDADGHYHCLAYSYEMSEYGIKAYEYIKKLWETSSPIALNAKKEYRMRCSVCGEIFCYKNEDIERNAKLQKDAKSARKMAVMEAIGGTRLASNQQTQRADNLESMIVDYSKCPKCNSTALVDISEDEL